MVVRVRVCFWSPKAEEAIAAANAALRVARKLTLADPAAARERGTSMRCGRNRTSQSGTSVAQCADTALPDKSVLVWSDPSGTVAPRTTPLNVWTPSNVATSAW